MELREYISSGILELYVMGSLSPQEMKEVEHMVAAHPEVAEELRLVEESLNGYAMAHSRNPRPAMRMKIISAATESPEIKIAKVIPLRQPSSLKYLLAACIVVLLISLIAVYSLFSKWKDAERRYADLQTQNQLMADNFKNVKNSYDKSVSDLNVLRNQQLSRITLQATDHSQNYLAHVYWNAQSHDAFIDVLTLPVPDANKQYQLWALVGGKPVDAGVFDVTTAGGIQKVKTVIQADAWAVTLEPKGGSVSPTLSQMYLLSKS